MIIGGSSGIGLATAVAARQTGAAVTVVGRDKDRLAAAAERIGDAATVVADLRDPAAIAEAVGQAGPIDHLVLAAGTTAGLGPVAEVDLDLVLDGLRTKVLGFIAAIRAAVPAMRAGGSITIVGASSATHPAPGAAGLAAINGAAEALVPTLAAELAPIRVNAVSPGLIDTPWWHPLPAEARDGVFAQYGTMAAVGRVGTAEEVAAAILALTGNGFITGAVLPVNGGV